MDRRELLGIMIFKNKMKDWFAEGLLVQNVRKRTIVNNLHDMVFESRIISISIQLKRTNRRTRDGGTILDTDVMMMMMRTSDDDSVGNVTSVIVSAISMTAKVF